MIKVDKSGKWRMILSYLTMAMIILLNVNVFANEQIESSENLTDKKFEENNVKDKSREIEKNEFIKELDKLDGETLYIKDNKKASDFKNEQIAKQTFENYDQKTPIEVDSIEELKSLINELKREEGQTSTNGFNIDLDENKNLDMFNDYSRAVRRGTGRATQWSPYVGGADIFASKVVDFSFNYDYYSLAGSYIFVGSSIPNGDISSYTTGSSLFTWTQTQASGSFSDDKRKANFNVKGYYLVGISFNGFEVGKKVPGSWNIQSKDINKYIK